MADFSQNIANFTKLGTYQYQFDSVGNEILNPSSSIFQQNYFAFQLTDLNYDQSKVESFYDPTFTEFVVPSVTTSSIEIVTTENLTQQIIDVTNQNVQLQAQLNELIVSSEQQTSDVDKQTIKNTIILLRVQQGQGKVISDFSSEFPYLPLPPDQQSSGGG